MQDEEAGPEEDHVEETDQAKKQGHIDAVLVSAAFLHHHRVEPIHDRTSKRHDVANGDLGLGFVGKVPAVRVVVCTS